MLKSLKSKQGWTIHGDLSAKEKKCRCRQKHLSCMIYSRLLSFFFLTVFFTSLEDIFLIAFRERGREREKYLGERSINWLPPVGWVSYLQIVVGVAGHPHRMEDQTHNLGMCPDQNVAQNPSVTGWYSNQLSHTSQGLTLFNCGKYT